MTRAAIAQYLSAAEPGRRQFAAAGAGRSGRSGISLGAAAEVRFLGDFAEGLFTVEPVHASDWLRIAELVAKYRDLPLGTADASVIAAAERRKLTTIATTDRRHFSIVRPRDTERFTVVP